LKVIAKNTIVSNDYLALSANQQKAILQTAAAQLGRPFSALEIAGAYLGIRLNRC
jgi:hypothetical protein